MSDVASTTATIAAKAKRLRIADRVYISPTGESRNAKPDSTSLEFRFSGGKKLAVKLSQFPAAIQACMGWHGLSQKLGDGFAAAKGNVASAIADTEDLIEVLMAGTWVEKGEGIGPVPSIIAEAIIRALKAEGQKVDETREASIKEKVKDKAQRDGALANPKIAAAYAAIRAERAAEKAKEAAAAAKTAPKGDLAGF